MASEFERIRWLSKYLGKHASGGSGRFHLGIGDDAAVWSPPRGHATVLTVDIQTEGTHFRRSWLDLESVGRRAVVAAASDLAAMAARPGGILLSLSLPSKLREAEFRALFRGVVREIESCGLILFGGNLSEGPLSVSITAIGHEKAARLLRRSKARAGDAIYVTGVPGSAALGRTLLGRKSRRPRGKAAERWIEAFRHPRARLSEARALARAIKIRAMIDISDGVASDLNHVLEESAGSRALGAILELDAIEALLADTRLGSKSLRLDPLGAFLDGGEDYELLFTTSALDDAKIPGLSRRLGLPITRIGELVRGTRGIRMKENDGKTRRLKPRGFDHFR